MKQLARDNNHRDAFNSILCTLQSPPGLCNMQAWDNPEGLVVKVRVGFLDNFVLGMEVVKERREGEARSACPQAGHGRRLVLGHPPGPLFFLGAWVGAAAAGSIHSACLRGEKLGRLGHGSKSQSYFPASVPRTKSELPSQSGEEQRRDPA